MKLDDEPMFIGAMRDITERKETEAQLRQAQKMEAVGQLTGGVAHDFNNLLTVTLGNLDMLQDHVASNPAAQELVDTAIKASERGADLTQRLLAYSRKQALDPEVTEINRLISNSIELLRRTLGEDIEIEAMLDDALWKAMVDPKQLENAILNLALNARDAMPDGGKLTIETANIYLDREYADTHDEVRRGRYVLIEVSDTGTGMPAEAMGRAFDPFFTTKEVGQGSGLGLSMVYGFAKQSGGHVAIYSQAGHGTMVKLYLPKVASAEGPIGVEPDQKMLLPKGNESLLVVEDDADVRAFITTALRSVGYSVIEAADGESALALADETPDIGLLITDVVLPHGMNGRDVADGVQKRRPSVKVLFTSGYPESAIVHQGKLDEGVELLTKPYTRETLARRVRQILDTPNAGARSGR
jgi:nitrogen-specific signal transduction histidine kinase/ActR/RegA family two-component response regulator